MFGFGRNGKDPLADAKSARRWIASFAPNDPLALHGELVAGLGRMADRATRRTPAQLEAVFALDAAAGALRRTLTSQYIEHAARSSKIENQLWSALFDLTQAFLLAYQAFARDAEAHGGSSRWQQAQAELCARQVVHLGLDARIRLYRYEQWIPAKWAELHALFSTALAQQFDRRVLTLADDGPATTIEHEYLLVLILQIMHAGNMTPRHIEYISQELVEWCQPLRFALEGSTTCSFYVDLAGREGLKRRGPAPLEGRVLFLDTGPLHAVLLQNVVVLEQKLKSQPLSERTPKRTEQLDLLQKLASQIDPEYKPFARRGERSAANGTVDAILGFSNIAAYLREEERDPLPQATASARSFDATMELAVFGRLRNEPERILEQARRRLARFAPLGGPWEVRDVSQTGFRMLAPMVVANAVTLGTLAALRPHGQVVWSLGIVRRIRRLTAERAEIGLQVVAHALMGVELIEQRRNAEGDYSIGGEPTTINARSFAGLFLALRKRDSAAPVHSLILPAPEYQASRRLKLGTGRSVNPIRLGRLIEQHGDWVWAAVETLDQNVQMADLSPITRA